MLAHGRAAEPRFCVCPPTGICPSVESVSSVLPPLSRDFAPTGIQQNFRAFAVRRRVSKWDMCVLCAGWLRCFRSDFDRKMLTHPARHRVANTVQSAFRGYIAREYVRKKRVDVYATKLQSVFRGWKGRRKAHGQQTGNEHDAARTVQAMWRGRQCRQAILRDMYHWCAAFQIQRAFR